MTLTIPIAMSKLYELLKENAPVRSSAGPKGKPGTNMYSPYPGNLMNNGIYQPYLKGPEMGTITLSGTGGKVGYLPYTNGKGIHKGWVDKSVNDFVNFLCSTYGGKRY